MSESLRIIFAGTPEFSVPPLEALLASQHQVVAVFTQPDRPAGRGRKLKPGPVKQVAEAHQVALYQPKTLKDKAVQAEIAALGADLMVVVAYGLILPQAVLDMPRLGCLNIHASLLPRWRGAAPIQRAILSGDTETGVAIMQMEAGLDTGAVWHTVKTEIGGNESAGQLHDRLAQLGSQALMQTLPGICSGEMQPEPQSEDGIVYAEKITKEEGLIDWKQSCHGIDRQIRAFNPWPVAYTRLNGSQMRIWEASLQDGDAVTSPGTVINADKQGILIQCGEGRILVEKLQMPGKRAMTAVEFLNAHSVQGVVLE